MKATQHQRLQLYVKPVEPADSITSSGADSTTTPAAAASAAGGLSAEQSVQGIALAEQTQPQPRTNTALPPLEQVLKDLSRHINKSSTTNGSSSSRSSVVTAPAAAAAMGHAQQANQTVIHRAVLPTKQQPSPGNAATRSHCSHYARHGTCATTEAGIEQLMTGLATVTEAAVNAAAAAAVGTTMLVAGAQQAAAALAAW
jgi:hypothetical protein